MALMHSNMNPIVPRNTRAKPFFTACLCMTPLPNLAHISSHILRNGNTYAKLNHQSDSGKIYVLSNIAYINLYDRVNMAPTVAT